MAVISETSSDDGGSNGGDQNKKPKEVEKKPKEEENRNKKLKEKLSFSLPIPDDLTLSCFALVPRCHYQALSLVSSNFRDIIWSRDLYVKRSDLGRTESVLYAYIRLLPLEKPSWYILHREPYRNLRNTFSSRLTLIDSLPPMPLGAAVVTIGSDIYVIGGQICGRPSAAMTLMDCKSHRYRLLPSMRMSRFRAGAGVVDGKIYVIGGCMFQLFYWVEVFDIKEQTWSGLGFPLVPKVETEYLTYAVLGKKIYLRGKVFAYVFEPETLMLDELLEIQFPTAWHESSCVIDDMLFCINPQLLMRIGLGSIVSLAGLQGLPNYPILVYDLKLYFNRIRYLKGLQGFPANMYLKECKLANFGGNLVILGTNQSRYNKYKGKKEIWCIEISLERLGIDDIWGKVESVDCGKVESVAVVLTQFNCSPSIELCRTVTSFVSLASRLS
ncbi:unnamed protein product [Arabidopsis halleri]